MTHALSGTAPCATWMEAAVMEAVIPVGHPDIEVVGVRVSGSDPSATVAAQFDTQPFGSFQESLTIVDAAGFAVAAAPVAGAKRPLDGLDCDRGRSEIHVTVRTDPFEEIASVRFFKQWATADSAAADLDGVVTCGDIEAVPRGGRRSGRRPAAAERRPGRDRNDRGNVRADLRCRSSLTPR